MKTIRPTPISTISPPPPLDLGWAPARRLSRINRASGSTFEAALALRNPDTVSRRSRRAAKRLGVAVLLHGD